MTSLRAIAVVLGKELVDALRDRRTLLTLLVSSVLLGPLVLIAISSLVANLEEQAGQRQIYVAGIEHAPTLRNYLERQTWAVKVAPTDFEVRLHDGRLTGPVVVIATDFERRLLHGNAPTVVVVADSANQRSQSAVAQVLQLLGGFNRERAMLGLALRGVSIQLLEAVRVDRRDLASTQARATQLTGLLPFFVLMAVLTGALNAALDTTAGERERGSLEPLLMNPTERWALVTGKWLAVTCVAMLIALLSSLSFVSGQWLLRSDSLAAMFQYGLREAMLFQAVLLPFAAMTSALLMAVAIRSRSFKEAQATSTLVFLVVSLLPLIKLFGRGTDAAWQTWVPALAQNVLMTRILKGEAFDFSQLAIALVVCTVLCLACLWDVTRTLRSAAIK